MDIPAVACCLFLHSSTVGVGKSGGRVTAHYKHRIYANPVFALDVAFIAFLVSAIILGRA